MGSLSPLTPLLALSPTYGRPRAAPSTAADFNPERHKMRYLFTTALASGALIGTALSAVTASAQQAQKIHYSGGFNCGEDEYTTNWNIRKDAAGEIALTVYFQQRGSSQVSWLDLTEHKSAKGMELRDANGNPRLDVAADGDTIRASWMRGAPQQDCSIFAVSRSDSPRDRFDQLFTLLDAPAADEDAAAKVADETRFPPIVHALPELDQNSYSQRYQTSLAEFWKRYRETMTSEIAALPITTEAERQALKARVDAALSSTMRASAAQGGHEDILRMLQTTADRLADAGIDPAATLGTSDAALMCQRYANINYAFHYQDMDKVQIAMAVPLDYWSRDLAERFLEDAPGCSVMHRSYTESLVNTWGDIQQRQQLIQTMREEQARLRALPATIATLVDTNNLQPDSEKFRQGYMPSDLAERFFGAPLDARRVEILSVAMRELDGKVAAYTIDQPETATQVSDLCNQLSYLRNLDDVAKGSVHEKCETAQATLEEKQSVAALAKIEAAFASAEPDSDAAKAARELCDSLPASLNGSARTAAYGACQDETVKLAKKQDELRCTTALANSGVSADFLETTVAVTETDGMSKAPLKDLVCGGATREIAVSFSSSGILMWKTHAMTVNFPRDNAPWRFVLVKDEAEDGADWTLAVEDPATLERLDKEDMPVEMVSACFTGSSACRPGR